MKTLFSLGRTLATPAALRAVAESDWTAADLFVRHAGGDWGDLCASDKQENEFALTRCLRLLSCYQIGRGRKVWIITEADRSATTLLLPEEY